LLKPLPRALVNNLVCSSIPLSLHPHAYHRCASSLLTNGCEMTYSESFDPIDKAGLPLDIRTVVARDYLEDDVEAVQLGGMVIKPLDMYDSSRKECRDLLDVELSKRGVSTYVEPGWVGDCPLLAVRISALEGEVSLNNRENLIFIEGGASRYAKVIDFIGHPIDCNIAMRMVLYKMSAASADYNSARGIEQVTFLINDQGFSGADDSGEFEGSSQVSKTVVNINILPVNDPPQVTMPRPTDFIEFDEHVAPQLQRVARKDPATPADAAAIDVWDVDSYECGSCSNKPGTFTDTAQVRAACTREIDPATGLLSDWEPGRITVTARVVFGRLSVATAAGPGITPIPDWAKPLVEAYLDPACSEKHCQSHKGRNPCELDPECSWNGKGCWCIKEPVGLQCNVIKIRGPSNAVRAAVAAMQYTPQEYYNRLTYVNQVERLSVTATDKRRPEVPEDPDFFCGDSSQLTEDQWFTTSGIDIQPVPKNDPAEVGIFPSIENPSFEYPAICEGPEKCDRYSPYCVGVAIHDANGWVFEGESGVTNHGWSGDATSASGSQHVFLHSHDNWDEKTVQFRGFNPSIAQNVTGFVLGMEYTVSIEVSARSDKQMGCMLNVSMQEDPARQASWLYSDEVSDAWEVGLIKVTNMPGNKGVDTWIPCRAWCELSNKLEQVNPGPSTDPFSPMPEITFVAHSSEYGIRLFADRTSGQLGDRMVFVDDVKIKATRILCMEDLPFLLQGLAIADPDVTAGSLEWVKTRPEGEFSFELGVGARQGKFDLVHNPPGLSALHSRCPLPSTLFTVCSLLVRVDLHFLVDGRGTHGCRACVNACVNI